MLKPKKYAPSTANPCDSCHFSSHVLDPNTKAIHVRAKFHTIRPEVQQLACLVLCVDTKHKHGHHLRVYLTCVCGCSPNFRRNLTPRMRGSKTHQKGRETQVTSSLGRSLELSYLFDKFECPSLRASNGMDLQHSVRKQSHVLGCGLWHEKPHVWPLVA